MAINLTNIQGNIFGGFSKDFQAFLFLKFKGDTAGRAWIAEIMKPDNRNRVSTSEEVLRFNNQFKTLTAQGIKPETVIAAAWTNLALSFQGLKKLGIAQTDLDAFPLVYREGMKARKTIIGDTGESDPAKWIEPFRSSDVHAILLVAADNETDLLVRIDDITTTAAFTAGVTILLQQDGRTRVDQPGHEHFGFKDGVSQPGIRGLNQPDDPQTNPDQGHPGQDLLHPGEFVLGYPTQIPRANGHEGLNTDEGSPSTSGPTWTADGSYLVFRRLQQDVSGFRRQVAHLARQQGISEDLMGAKLVGRYKSGCPLEATKFQVAPTTPSLVDPGIANPALADSDALNNDFEFGDDADGAICPLGAHIRKAYPRDEQTLPDALNPTAKREDSESETQTHRLLRRGIPFGHSFGAVHGGGAHDSRGLLFLAYQTDLVRQFEFVQSQWVNEEKFPPFPTGAQPGQDPIIAQSKVGPFELSLEHSLQVKHFVTTTGGEYFFAPSIDALTKIGSNMI